MGGTALVTPGYFEALPVPLLQGRAFESRDSRTASAATVISLRVNALIAVLLAISGVYPVVAFAVARRRGEIAIRVALGGSRPSIVAMPLRQSLRPALRGIVVGLVFSAIISRAIALVLFGVNPLDPLTYTP